MEKLTTDDLPKRVYADNSVGFGIIDKGYIIEIPKANYKTNILVIVEWDNGRISDHQISTLISCPEKQQKIDKALADGWRDVRKVHIFGCCHPMWSGIPPKEYKRQMIC
jgi:hypothetical protein